MVHCHERAYKVVYGFFLFLYGFFFGWLSTGLFALRYFDTNRQNDKEGFFMKSFISFKKYIYNWLRQAIVFIFKIQKKHSILM